MDLKIIGAGPGGILSGLYLLENGITPRILERQSRENYKSTPCAEGVSRGTIDKLKRDIGFDSSSFINNEPDRAVLSFPSGRETFWEYPVPVILDRTEWLWALIEEFERRGGHIEFDKEVGDIDDLDYDYLIGADGPNSRVRRRIGGDVRIVSACQYRFKPEEYQRKVLELHWDKRFSEFYSWIFPKKDYLNIGCGGSYGGLDRFLSYKNMNGEILERKAHPITFGGTNFQEGNIFLIGDAAGMLNPVLGDGLGPIVFASEVLSFCFGEGDLGMYEKILRKKLPDSQVTDVLLSLNQRDLDKLGNLLDGVNFLDFLKALMGGSTVLDFFKEDVIFEMLKGNFLRILHDPRFLVKLASFYRNRGRIKESLKLWSKRT